MSILQTMCIEFRSFQCLQIAFLFTSHLFWKKQKYSVLLIWCDMSLQNIVTGTRKNDLLLCFVN